MGYYVLRLFIKVDHVKSAQIHRNTTQTDANKAQLEIITFQLGEIYKAQIIKMRLLISLFFVIEFTTALNFPLTRSRQTCFVVTQGKYQLQYVVSGNGENGARCIVQENSTTLLQVKGKSEYEGQFEIKESQGSICFSSMDTHSKSVSFDFIKTDDPLRGLILDKEKLQIHQSLYKSYQQLQKLYRDQHFFLQRNYIHQILLRNTEVSVIFFLLLKLMIIFICAFLQLYYVKSILENNYKPLPSQQSLRLSTDK